MPLVLKKEGSTLISAIFLILFASFMGSAVVQIDSADTISSANNLKGTQALYVGQAGLESAKRKLDLGGNPDMIDQPFGYGSYTITSDLNTQLVTVNSLVGDARRVQSIQGNFSDQCVTLDTTAAVVQGSNLQGVKLVKTCNTAAIVTKVTIDWNWPQCGLQPGDDPYAPYYDPNHPGKIFICHQDDDEEETISISISAWENGHSSHEGDYLGECDDDADEDDDGDDDGAGLGGDTSGGDPAPCDDFDHDGDHDHQNALINALSLAGTVIYDSSQGIGLPSPGGAEPNVAIDVVDYTLTTNGDYVFTGANSDILYSTTIPAGGWYMITVEFADYSTIYSVFTP